VLPGGDVVRLGGTSAESPGYDLTGLIVGSEGTLGIVTRIWVRLVPINETVKTILAVFRNMEDASSAVAGMIARRIVPAAIEMMDNLTIRAIESRSPSGYPVDAEGVVLIEVDGLREEVDAQAPAVEQVCFENKALSVRLARDDAERAALWAGRKGAFAAIGRLTPDYYTVDGVVPRTKLPATLARIQEISRESGFRIANVFHAGDGNLHPLILWDADVAGAEEQVIDAGAEIMRVCAAAGGSLSGEHGIGMEKKDLMPLIFSQDDVAQMLRIKAAMDPSGLCNPGKLFPTAGRCLELFARRGRAVGW
jgi:glycolate oxidase